MQLSNLQSNAPPLAPQALPTLSEISPQKWEIVEEYGRFFEPLRTPSPDARLRLAAASARRVPDAPINTPTIPGPKSDPTTGIFRAYLPGDGDKTPSGAIKNRGFATTPSLPKLHQWLLMCIRMPATGRTPARSADRKCCDCRESYDNKSEPLDYVTRRLSRPFLLVRISPRRTVEGKRKGR